MSNKNFLMLNIAVVFIVVSWFEMSKYRLAKSTEQRLRNNSIAMVNHWVKSGYITKDQGEKVLDKENKEIDALVEKHLQYKFLGIGK